VAVLGATTASELFTREDPVGQTVDVNGVPVTVVGVLTSTGASTSSSSTSDPDDTMIIPITTGAERIFGGTSRNSVSSIAVQARSSADLTGAYQEADHLLLQLHGITDSADADFTITSQASLIAANTSVDHTLTILLGGIAAIALGSVAWFITLLYQGFKNASGLQGPKLVGGFVAIVIVAETISKIAIVGWS